ncbi:hypothetical protein [Parapusillimonas granuli]|uniref:HTH deoR-type domain-containing protein n=1 Tax=Parapusillimonas granuli TaxID=380911 RepID=A0A853G003_9BURK|nr:hypothetical protein [Parapusillimonas granuli]MBB5217608.1 putative transcriptional regulator [Parapusillimonas granuli]NYT49629.1 hypothetical protein [Parapusillimonas granuli]
MEKLTSRQQRIFEQFVQMPEELQSVADFAALGLERTTIFWDIKKLVQAGLLEPEGKAYRINRASDAWLRWDLSRAPLAQTGCRLQPRSAR